jgi:hypothetical protein
MQQTASLSSAIFSASRDWVSSFLQGWEFLKMARISLIRLSHIMMVSSILGACGRYVPEVQEFWGDENDASINVNNIAGQVACELGQALREVIQYDIDNPPRRLKSLEKWGAQVTLNLVVEEKSTFNPGVSLNTPMHNATVNFAGETLPSAGGALVATLISPSTYSFLSLPQSYSFGIGGQLSSAATRTDKYQFLYKVSDFLKGGSHWQEGRTDRTCLPRNPANATLFPQTDLKIGEWVRAMVLPARTGTGDPTPTAANGITHDVKFVIVTDGNVSPNWKLVRVSANTFPNNPLFDASRTRTQEAIITVGPLSEGGGGGKGKPAARTLAVNAQDSHLAAEIGSAVAAALKGQQ